MKIIHTVKEMQSYADHQKMDGRVLGLVPTMGSLHEGHLSLVRRAKEVANHITVTIFVNPTQFGPNEDFETYPRDFDRDCRLLQEVGGVDVVFAPNTSTFYEGGVEQNKIWITCPEMTRYLCGNSRPGHFDGVLTVVMKLFAACKPHVSIFGLKDIQQYMLLKKMVHDLSLDIKIIGAQTVREPSGLAYSSRNNNLSLQERRQAEVLSHSVTSAVKMIETGQGTPSSVIDIMEETIGSAPLAKLQYAEIVAADTLHPVDEFTPGMQVIAAVSVNFRDIRLIDNAITVVPLA